MKQACTRFPAMFVAHGAGPLPLLSPDLDRSSKRPTSLYSDSSMAAHLRDMSSDLPETPRAILLISGHWEESTVTVSSMAKPDMIYDYYGFPPESYTFKYDAPGSPEVAAEVLDLLQQNGIECESQQRGYDHGAFVPLMLGFPEAQIPVVSLSLHSSMDPKLHVKIGKALAPLRESGVLMIGSGMSFHNMRLFSFTPTGRVHGGDFDSALTEALNLTGEDRRRALEQWTSLPGARNAHPREEHLIPLHVIVGAAGDDEPVTKTYDEVALDAKISAFRFGY